MVYLSLYGVLKQETQQSQTTTSLLVSIELGLKFILISLQVEMAKNQKNSLGIFMEVPL